MIEESLAEAYDSGIHFDATDETLPPGTRRYRKARTFKGYLLGDEDPLHPAAVERFRQLAPEGFWE